MPKHRMSDFTATAALHMDALRKLFKGMPDHGNVERDGRKAVLLHRLGELEHAVDGTAVADLYPAGTEGLRRG